MKNLFLCLLFLSFRFGICQSSETILKPNGEVPIEFKSTIKDKTNKLAIEKKYGKEFSYRIVSKLQSILNSEYVVFGDSLTLYIQNLVNTIKEQNAIQIPISVFVINSSTVNAYALAPGYIFVNTGLFANISSEDQLYFVLCHEIAHLSLEHSFNFDNTIKKLGKRTTKKDEMSIIKELEQLSKYSKDQELEADKKGIEFFKKSLRNESEVIKALENLDNIKSLDYKTISTNTKLFESIDSLEKLIAIGRKITKSVSLSTHPDLELRISKAASNVGKRSKKALIDTNENQRLTSLFDKHREQCLFNASINGKAKGDCFGLTRINAIYSTHFDTSRIVDLCCLSAISCWFMSNYNENEGNMRAEKKRIEEAKELTELEELTVKIVDETSRLKGELFLYSIDLYNRNPKDSNKMAIYMGAIYQIAIKEENLGLKTIDSKGVISNSMSNKFKNFKIELSKEEESANKWYLGYKNYRVFNMPSNTENIAENKISVSFQSINFNKRHSEKHERRRLNYFNNEVRSLNKNSKIKLELDSRIKPNCKVEEVEQTNLTNTIRQELVNNPSEDLPLLLPSILTINDSTFFKKNHITVYYITGRYLKEAVLLETVPRKATWIYIAYGDVSSNQPKYILFKRIDGKPKKGIVANLLLNSINHRYEKN